MSVDVRTYAWAALSIAIVTALGLAVFEYVTTADITMMYLIGIMLASLLGRGPSIVAASLAVAAFDWFFVQPRFTFKISGLHQLLTFVVMFASGLVIGTLVVRLRGEQQAAVAREQRTAQLQSFTRAVAGATTLEDVATVLARQLEDHFDVAAAVLVPDAGGGLVAASGLMALAEKERAAVEWSFGHRQQAGHGTETLPEASALCVPLIAADTVVGVLAIQLRRGAPAQLGSEQRELVDAFARQAAVALGRVQLGEQARESALRARTEELRSSLLSAVSHDLRTPLAVITGAATSLVQHGDTLSADARSELLASIVDDAKRLERVLTNLLQLTRVETGLQPAREWIPAEEVIGSALTRTEELRHGDAVAADVAPDLLLDVDPVLFEQVLINLIENATKHGAAPFSIHARAEGEGAVIEVADRGAGLPAGDTGALFGKGVRASPAPGAGLGLAVVRAIVEAHGGTVTAENRADGGALFRVRLPARVPPALPARVAS